MQRKRGSNSFIIIVILLHIWLLHLVLHVHLLLLRLSTEHVVLIDGCARHYLLCELLLLISCIYLFIEHLLPLGLFFGFILELFGLEMRVLEVLAVDETEQNEE